MKTLKILIALCIILGFATNNAYSQKVIGTQENYWTFSPNPDEARFQIPCLEEVVSGTVTEYQSFTKMTYHVLARGVLNGDKGGIYELSYEYNSCGQGFAPNPIYHPNESSYFILPLLLKHDGKLVAELQIVGKYVINGQGVYVTNQGVFNVNCR